MKLYGARVFVTDIEEARAFYGDTLGLQVSFETEGAIGFDMGALLIVEADDGEHENLSGRFTGLSIATVNIENEYRRLKSQGVEFTGPPEIQPWGGTLVHFTDPSRNIWTLVQV